MPRPCNRLRTAGSAAPTPDPQRIPALPPRRFRQPLRGAGLRGARRNRLQFLRCPRPAPEHACPTGSSASRPSAFARRLIGAGIEPGERLVLIADTWPGFCVAFFGAQYAGVVPVPVARAGRARRQDALHLPAQQADRRLAGAVGVRGARRAGRVRPDRRRRHDRALCRRRCRSSRPCPSPRSSCGRSAPGCACYVQFSSGSTRAPLGVDIRQDQLMANIDGSIAAPAARRRRFRRELAAALSRHGPDRVHPGADVRTAQRRPAGAARLRPPADAVAVADLAPPRDHHLQPELRLRPARATRARRCRSASSTCRACAWPASAPT